MIHLAVEREAPARIVRQLQLHELKQAGEALDLARRLFTRKVKDPNANESAFGRAETRFLVARERYRALLEDITGESAADLERRISV